MSRFADCGTWTGEGLRREVFFFDSGGTALYGSLYSGLESSRPFGLVACSSWGVEADRTDPLVRSVALAMARLGGAAMVFHYPGYGDSYGDLAAVGLAELGAAAGDALAAAAQRSPRPTWILAGFMLGGAVACLARRQAAPGPLLLVQPTLRPSDYFRRLSERRRPLALGSSRGREALEAGDAPGMSYGYPFPQLLLDRTSEADAAVAGALAAFDGEGAVVRYASPAEDGSIPKRFERVEAPGAWRFGATLDRSLVEATVAWLERRTGAGSG